MVRAMAFDPFTAGFDLVKTSLDKFFPDANEEMRLKLGQAAQGIQNEYALQLAQISTNTAEAGSNSVFVSGARPFILWVCGVALAYSALIEPFARFLAVVAFDYAGTFPAINTEITSQILMGMLGLSGYRTVEKLKNVARK